MPAKVTVFLGWSGPRSKAVAIAFRDWLPQVIQAADPWLSEAMDRGAQWFTTIGTHLKTADYGLLCVTPENVDEPWVLFEAGALALRTSERLACPYLLDMVPAALTGPLAQLQAATADRDGTRQVVETINKLLDEGVRLSEDRLRRAFDRWWPDLEAKLAEARQAAAAAPAPPARSQDDKLDELLDIARALQRSPGVFDTSISSGVSNLALGALASPDLSGGGTARVYPTGLLIDPELFKRLGSMKVETGRTTIVEPLVVEEAKEPSISPPPTPRRKLSARRKISKPPKSGSRG